MDEQRYVTAEDAAAILDISRATLYSYVSRELIRSEPARDGSRRHRYVAADVEALLRRREQRRNPAGVAEQALHWGAPLLESAITLIDNGRVYYRGRDAADLAAETSFEAVAGLIWTGKLSDDLFAGTTVCLPHGWTAHRALSPIGQFQSVLPLAAANDPAAYDLRPEGVVNAGARIVCLLARVLAGTSALNQGIAAALQQGWELQPAAQHMLNATLILCADHELNTSAFTARCIASAGATPYAVVQGGLAALQGVRHGGYTERVEALLRDVTQAEEARDVVAARLRRGESLPGFGHPLYPQGDPRARILLQMAQEQWPQSAKVEPALAVVAAAEELLGVRPTLDFGLVSITRALDLPPGSALALFALGRTVGWIGHALEQYAAGTLIRPRARYIGQRPAAT